MLNVAQRLTKFAQLRPDAIAIAVPGRNVGDKSAYRRLTFRQLDERSTHFARGLWRWGVPRGSRLALLVPPSLDFYVLVFGLLKAEMVQILIDPGMGKRNLIRCLADAEPRGFCSVPVVQYLRCVLRQKFPQTRWNVSIGRAFGTEAKLLREIELLGASSQEPLYAKDTSAAAIIFTTGSTGPPKGVLYSHENFDQQVAQLQEHFAIRPGEIDLPGFPLFGLFNAAMGVTTVVPRMDFTRPARVNPENILAAAEAWHVTQAFGSPALWDRVGPYCRAHGRKFSTLMRVMSAGAPVPPRVLENMVAVLPEQARLHTPYGATEALPVASISAAEVLGETAVISRQGNGTCIGRKFSGIEWKVIQICDGPMETIAGAQELPQGEIGELIVRGPVVTSAYVTRTESNALAKIKDGTGFWHRMGDVGYLDVVGRFWFCGRMAHRVVTPSETLFTVRCEAIFNTHPKVFRSALVGIGSHGQQRPVIIVETWPDKTPKSRTERATFLEELKSLAASNTQTVSICDFLFHPSLPVDIRHNSKIFREQLAPWAAAQLGLACEPAKTKS
jgi:acyl-CoA synthetase (AMP-forming)/AMP-acid ligase II